MARVDIHMGPAGPVFHLQRSDDAAVEKLTQQQAHALLDEHEKDPDLLDVCMTAENVDGCWWCLLYATLHDLR